MKRKVSKLVSAHKEIIVCLVTHTFIQSVRPNKHLPCTRCCSSSYKGATMMRKAGLAPTLIERGEGHVWKNQGKWSMVFENTHWRRIKEGSQDKMQLMGLWSGMRWHPECPEPPFLHPHQGVNPATGGHDIRTTELAIKRGQHLSELKECGVGPEQSPCFRVWMPSSQCVAGFRNIASEFSCLHLSEYKHRWGRLLPPSLTGMITTLRKYV